jgi:hypothetical protein
MATDKTRRDSTASAAARPARDPLRDGLKAVARAAGISDSERTALVTRSATPKSWMLKDAMRAVETAMASDDQRETTAPSAKTQLMRGGQKPGRSALHAEPVVGWLVIIGGPGLGAFRTVHEGNNTIGRAASQRIPLDFGDDTISSEEQAYIRYDASDRAFLFVPNLAKTNVVSVNQTRPTAAVPLVAMDVITIGRTQLVFVPFCGEAFDWSDLAELKE